MRERLSFWRHFLSTRASISQTRLKSAAARPCPGVPLKKTQGILDVFPHPTFTLPSEFTNASPSDAVPTGTRPTGSDDNLQVLRFSIHSSSVKHFQTRALLRKSLMLKMTSFLGPKITGLCSHVWYDHIQEAYVPHAAFCIRLLRSESLKENGHVYVSATLLHREEGSELPGQGRYRDFKTVVLYTVASPQLKAVLSSPLNLLKYHERPSALGL